MPTYEYECQNCKEHFEVFQTITASRIKECPKCKGSVNRLISGGGGFIFKGPGFYATDYRKEKKKAVLSCPLGKEGQGCKSCPEASSK